MGDSEAKFEGIGEVNAYKKLAMEYFCVPSTKEATEASKQTATFISNSFSSDATLENTTGNELFGKLFGDISKKANEFGSELMRIISIMRLFKEGSVRLSAFYYFVVFNGEAHGVITSYGKGVREFETHLMTPYVLPEFELDRFQSFLRTIKFPFEQDYIQLCHENFELSYYISNNSLAFLSLITALEVLFNTGSNEITYRLSRSLAALLSKNKKEFDGIFKDMRKLYEKRSVAIHGGRGREIVGDDVIHLRDYVRRSILAANGINKSKRDMVDLLNTVGFGAL